MHTEIRDNEIQPVWSFWKTMWISLFIITAGNFLIQILVLGGHIAWSMFQSHNFTLNNSVWQSYARDLFQKSSVISETILFSDFISLIMILFFVALKNRDNMKAYLGFKPVKPVIFIIWQAVMIATFYGMNFIVSQTSVEEPEFMKLMRDILSTESFGGLLLMLTAVVIAAPLFEEMMFRGFMYTGILHSRLGVFGAILIPSVIWSLVHLQYEWIWILMIFIMGIIFTLARYLTGSIYTVIAMHAINNFLSFVDVIRS